MVAIGVELAIGFYALISNSTTDPDSKGLFSLLFLKQFFTRPWLLTPIFILSARADSS